MCAWETPYMRKYVCLLCVLWFICAVIMAAGNFVNWIRLSLDFTKMYRFYWSKELKLKDATNSLDLSKLFYIYINSPTLTI